MTIYLYVKTHRKTGLKYLGKTEQDPYKYRGSGVYWKSHLKKYGNDVGTIVICECSSKEEARDIGIHYSTLWNVVESPDWANLKPEEGDGNSSETTKQLWQTPAIRDKIITSLNKPECREEIKIKQSQYWNDPKHRIEASERSKRLWENSEFRNVQSEINKKRWKDSEYRKLRTSQAVEMWEDSEFRKNQIEKANKRWENSELREQARIWAIERWKDPEYRANNIAKNSGKNSHRYDDTIHHFIHDDGTEERCTKHDLYTKYSLNRSKIALVANGDRKSHKGWRVIK